MSRSYRKTPIVGITTAASEKKDKQKWHRSLRRQTTEKLNTEFRDLVLDQPEAIAELEELPPIENEISPLTVGNPWGMSKDGRHWCGDYVEAQDVSPEEKAERKRSIFNK